jgi:hypothetical protein
MVAYRLTGYLWSSAWCSCIGRLQVAVNSVKGECDCSIRVSVAQIAAGEKTRPVFDAVT